MSLLWSVIRMDVIAPTVVTTTAKFFREATSSTETLRRWRRLRICLQGPRKAASWVKQLRLNINLSLIISLSLSLSLSHTHTHTHIYRHTHSLSLSCLYNSLSLSLSLFLECSLLSQLIIKTRKDWNGCCFWENSVGFFDLIYSNKSYRKKVYQAIVNIFVGHLVLKHEPFQTKLVSQRNF